MTHPSQTLYSDPCGPLASWPGLQGASPISPLGCPRSVITAPPWYLDPQMGTAIHRHGQSWWGGSERYCGLSVVAQGQGQGQGQVSPIWSPCPPRPIVWGQWLPEAGSSPGRKTIKSLHSAPPTGPLKGLAVSRCLSPHPYQPGLGPGSGLPRDGPTLQARRRRPVQPGAAQSEELPPYTGPAPK